jgi:hypothetical protein
MFSKHSGKLGARATNSRKPTDYWQDNTIVEVVQDL